MFVSPRRQLLTTVLFVFVYFHFSPFAALAQSRIAILGCHREYRPAPALYRYVEARPDISIWVGDNVYADAESDPAIIEDSYARLEAKPAFQVLRDSSVFLVTWDDHDFGLNNAGKEYILKEESKAIFRAFWSLEDEIPVDQEGIYYAKTFAEGEHTLQVILLDVRYNRDQPYSGGDVLGEAQWEWFEEQLEQPATLRFIVSGMQVLLDAASGSETWDQFPEAQQRLFETIKKSRAEGVVFITGDQHYAEVGRMPVGLDYDLVELQFASINQIEDPEFNAYRVSPVARSLHTYAYIDVQWEEDEFDVPHLVFQVRDALDDRIELTYRVNFSELKRAIAFDETTSFVGTHHVSLFHRFPNLDVRYTVNGSQPGKDASIYSGPIEIDRSTTITAALFDREGMRRSAFQEQEYHKMEVVKSVSRPGGLKRGLAYTYAEGTFTVLPDFAGLPALKSGTAQDFDVAALAEREDHYAIEYTGYIQVPETGLYTFYTYSDDGSQLIIGDRLVVDNDGSHSARLKEGVIALEAGFHPLRLRYFEDYDGQVLKLEVKGPGDSYMKSVSFDTLFHP